MEYEDKDFMDIDTFFKRTLFILITNIIYSVLASYYFIEQHIKNPEKINRYSYFYIIGPLMCSAEFFFWIRLFMKGTNHSKFYSPETIIMIKIGIVIDILW